MQFQISSRDTWVIKTRGLTKTLSTQFWFIRGRRQHIWAVEWRRYSKFTFVENTIRNLPKVPRAMFLGSDGLYCFSSKWKFGKFKNTFATITSLSELYLRFIRFILLVHTKKKWFLWTMTTAQAAESYRDEWSWTWYLPWEINTSIPTWTHSQISLAAAEALRLKASSHETPLK